LPSNRVAGTLIQAGAEATTRICGVDPGLRVTGYAVIDVRIETEKVKLVEAGIVRTDRTQGIGERLKSIHDGLRGALAELSPDVLVLEKMFSHCNHPTTAILMGHARGVACLAAAAAGIPLISVASTHVKKSVTGSGHAGKGQVQRMVQYRLGLARLPEPCDVADALAIALSYIPLLRGKKKS